jgi:bifunctional DNA-binding transcriptional regulator/antitoxin component of YhaV-PrlF toxin-antitoxin module
VKIGKKGQVTIPRSVLKAAGIAEESRVMLEATRRAHDGLQARRVQSEMEWVLQLQAGTARCGVFA